MTLNQGEMGKILDGEMGVDRIVNVTTKSLLAPIVFTVQERFRRPQFAKYQDLTITEWNHVSGMPSELYKINAGLFLYGYYDMNRKVFVDAICVTVPDLLLAIVTDEIKYEKRRNKKQQTFFTFKFEDLIDVGVVCYRLENNLNKM